MTASFIQRRARLREALTGAQAIGRFRDGFDANLFYLTGLRERACLLLTADGEETLFLPARDEREIAFDGAGPDPARTGVSRVRHVTPAELEKELARHAPAPADETRRRLAELRWVKDEDERALMRRAAAVSRAAHDQARSLLRDGLSEWELRVEFERALFLSGCRETAYTTIAAADGHANTLHYVEAAGAMRAGGVVLLDGGGKIDGYCADITSTWVVGEATDEQARVFEIVRRAQDEVIALVRPGVTLNELQARAEEVMAAELLRARIVRDRGELRELFPHRVSHWLGIDVHDPKISAEDGARPLVEGVVLTVEPGLYFHERTARDYGRYRGIAARFEEDCLVTKDGVEVLSRA